MQERVGSENANQASSSDRGGHSSGSGSGSPGRKKSSPGGRVVMILLLVAACGLSAWAVIFFSQKKEDSASKKGGDRPVPVTVATAATGLVPIEIHSIGNVLAYSTVNVVPQVSGQLSKVFFTQGQYVKTGEMLFQIDERPYRAALAQAMGNVSRDQAQVQQAQANLNKDQAAVGQLQANKQRDEASAKYAGVEVGRYATLVAQGAVSHEQSDQINTNLLTAQATTEADQKAIENAQAVVNADKAAISTARGTLEADRAVADTNKIQLGWCQIKSPLDGRTSSLNVYEGNIVTANTNTPLVSIAQVQPIYVNFTVPEQNLDLVRQNLSKGSLKVEAYLEGVKADSVLGNVSFLESAVNTATGTVVLRASFPNKDLRLFPGQFVDVVVSMPADGETVTVPAQCLQTTQQGTSVWVVNQDQSVNLVPVTVKRTRAGIAALGTGVKNGDTVVTDGQLQLTPKSHIKVVKDSSTIQNQTSATPGG